VSVLLNHSHVWSLLAVGAALVAAAAWFYRRVPPAASRHRPLLLALRVAALLLLIAALLEPVLALTRTVTERPVVALLLDSSKSMAIADGTGGARRGDEAVALLNEVVLPRLARDSELEAFSFSAATEELPTERGAVTRAPSFDGGVTDIAQAFEFVSKRMAERNLTAVVIATDGADNRGAGPYEAAASLGVPVFVLGVGSAEPGTDIAIEDAVTNRISYAGESVPVEVTVSSAGYGGAETVVELREGGVLLDSRRIELSGTGEEATVTFRVTPTEPGVHRYVVSVPQAAGELSTANNSRVVVTTAMKGKIRVLLVAERPGLDYAFVRRELEADSNVDLTSVVRLAGSPVADIAGTQPASREELFAYDLVVLVEPDWSRSILPAGWLTDFVRDRGGGVLALGIPDGPPGEAAALMPYVLSSDVGSGRRDVRVRLTDVGEGAPAARVVGDRFDNVRVWRQLPPVTTAAAAVWAPRADASVLVEEHGSDEDAAPIVIGRRFGAGGVLAVLAEGLWRWKMAGPETTDVLGTFVANAARWLTARGELERVVVSTDKDVYRAGEDVRVSAQVYRSDFRLAPDADVTVSVASGEGAAPVAEVALRPDGDHYRGSVPPLAPGSYVVECSATLRGEDVGSARSEFLVERFSLEDAETRRRPAVLRKVAEDTGGGYYSPGTLDQLPESFPMAWAERSVRREFELWNSPWLLLGFVGLISVEWALRRKQGLP